MYLPIAHAEGKFVVASRTCSIEPETARPTGVAVLRSDSRGSAMITLPFPVNPNGSMANVAGLCDETGRVLGLMPHPERHIERTHHPRWTRGEGQEPGDGLAVFQNAVRYFA